MDVQKVAAQSATGTQHSGQRKDDDKPSTLASFIDMIRKPMIMATNPSLDPFTAQKDYAAKTQDQGPEPSQDANDVRRDDNVRSDRSAKDDRRDDDQAAPREARNDASDDARNDDHEDDVPVRADADDADSNTNNADADTETADNDTKSESSDDTAQATDGDDATDDTVKAEGGPNAFENAADAEMALAPAIDNLKTETETGKGDVAAEQVVAAVTPGADANRAANQTAKNTPQQQQTPADAAQNKAQAAKDALARVGTQAANTDNAGQKGANNGQQSLADQQAQALASQLKPEKPVKVQVRVTDRGATTANTTPRAENANTQTRADTAQTAAKPSLTPRLNPQQVATNATAEARADQAAAAQGQAQAQAQLAKAAANGAADAGLTRAAARVSNVNTHTVGGAESSNATGQATAQTQQSTDAQRAAQTQASRQSAPSRPIVQQISVNITKAVADGLDKINIQLRPEELGRVEVKLEVNNHGRVSAHIVADRPETLELLRNDARSLEKALQEAGFDTGSGDLSFDLRQQDNNQDGNQSGSAIAGAQDGADSGDAEAELAQMLINGEPLHIISEDRVDIRA